MFHDDYRMNAVMSTHDRTIPGPTLAALRGHRADMAGCVHAKVASVGPEFSPEEHLN